MQIVNDFIALLRLWRGWKPDTEDPLQRLRRLEKLDAHRDLIRYYSDHVIEFEGMQQTYFSDRERKRRRWHPHVPTTLLEQDMSSWTESRRAIHENWCALMSRGVRVSSFDLDPGEDPLCRDDLPIAIWLRCPFLCKECVGYAILDLQFIQREMRHRRTPYWNNLGEHERAIVGFFRKLPDPGMTRYKGPEIATETHKSYSNPNFKSALRNLVDGNVLFHHGKRLGYSLRWWPRGMPEPDSSRTFIPSPAKRD